MFSRFTASARRVMQQAFREAKRWQHDFVGTEHLLFGLLSDESGPAFIMLRSLNARPNLMLDKVELSLQQHDEGQPHERFPLSPALRRAFDFADAEAANFRHRLIAPEHLLLGLMREGECSAAQIMLNHGVALNELRIAVALLPIEALPDAQIQASDAKRSAAPASMSAVDLEDQVMPIQTVDYQAGEGWLQAFHLDVASQLHRTQIVLGCFAGFVLGYWTFALPGGAALALVGGIIAYCQRIWLSILVGAMLPPLAIFASGMWREEKFAMVPIVMLAGGFLGAYLCAPWQTQNLPAHKDAAPADSNEENNIIAK